MEKLQDSFGAEKRSSPGRQHMCSIDSPEFKDALLIARAKKGNEHTPEEHMIISRALKHKKAQACAS